MVNRVLLARESATLSADADTSAVLNEQGRGGFVVVSVGEPSGENSLTVSLYGTIGTDGEDVEYAVPGAVSEPITAAGVYVIAVDRFPRYSFARLDIDGGDFDEVSVFFEIGA